MELKGKDFRKRDCVMGPDTMEQKWRECSGLSLKEGAVYSSPQLPIHLFVYIYCMFPYMKCSSLKSGMPSTMSEIIFPSFT